MQNVLTVCPYCGSGCGVYLGVEDGVVTGSSPSLGHPIGQGKLCKRGWHAHEFVRSPNRLRQPMVRKGGRLAEVSWQEAISTVASGLGRGPEVAVLGSGRCTNEDNYLLMRLGRQALGTNNVDCVPRAVRAADLAALGRAFGAQATPASQLEIAQADVILVCGSETERENPKVVTSIMEALNAGAALIVISPRQGQLARLARVHLAARPGTEVALIAALADPRATAEAAQGSAVSAEALRDAANLIKQAARPAAIYGGNASHQAGSSAIAEALAALVAGRGMILPLSRYANLQGACDMGLLPHFLTGYQPVADAAIRQKFASAWGGAPPAEPGLPFWRMAGTVKSAYLMGADPMVSSPDPAAAREFLEGLDFLVVQDIFPTEAAGLAQVVLPAASFAEKEGTFTSLDRRVQRVRKAVEPPGQARADWQILCEVAGALGVTFPYGSSPEIMDEIARLTPAYGAISYQRLDADWGMQWAMDGTGRAPQASPAEAPPVQPTPEYPFILSLDTAMGTWEANTMCRQPGTLQRECAILHADFRTAPPVEMHPDTMKELGARPMGQVRLVSAAGVMTAAIRPNPEVPKQVLLVPYYAREQARVVLGEPVTAAEDGAPMFAPRAVKVEMA